jgi:Tfp pilus assembly protein PilX
MTKTTSRRSRESGSAYIIALLALVVLTILGLALTFMTQTEMLVGGNDRVVHRVFYSADSGIGGASESALVTADYSGRVVTIPDAVAGSSLAMANRVSISPFYPIYDAPCNLCEINDAGTYSDKAYRKINHAVTTNGERRAPDGTVVASKQISAMVEVQPWQANTEAYRPIDDPAQLAQIKF